MSSALSARLSRLSPAARQLLESRLRGTSGPAQIPRLSSTEPARLSCAQERFWFLQQWDPNSSAYNCSPVFQLRGPLDVDALQRSLDALVVRHEGFRTRFALNGDAPCQTILPPSPVDILLVDLSHTHGEEQDSSLRVEVREQVERVFDLGSGRLLRAALFALAENHHVLALATHHIVWDGWSRSVMCRELETLYGQFVAGHTPALDPLPIQYRDFAAWQRSRLDSGALAGELAYWTDQLRSAPHVLELPADAPRPSEQSFSGATHVFTVDTAMVDRLRAIARTEGATLFVALLAAFASVIRQWTERDDFIIGVPIAGRSRVETEGLIGCFINTLALRLNVSGQLTYLEVLRRARQTSLEAFANAELPFAQVIDAAAPRRGSSHSPLVQVMFALQNTPQRPLALHDLEVRPLTLDYGTSKLDLTLEATETPAGLSCALEFNTELFELPTITRLAERWQIMLAAVVDDPLVEIGRVPLLTADERRLLATWNSTETPRPAGSCVHGWFERQARQGPEAVALVAGPEHVTYGDLDRRANRLAHLLCREGATHGTLVGVCIERSVDLIVALLAILKSGAAYVPLDRAYPDERLAGILAQARPMMVLCDAPLPPATAAVAAAVLNVRAARPLIAQQPCVSPAVVVADDDLAYVLFTSGSTGTPKGVMMPHAPVCNRIQWLQATFPILPADRMLHHTSISFDVSVGEIFCGLAAGATLVLADPDGQRDPAYLAGLIAAERVTVVDVVPRMLQALLDEPAFTRCRLLRQVHCGAESLPPELARLFLSRSTATLLNFYGPTETCIDVTVWRCDAGVPDRVIPIGRPIDNVRIHILDRERRPVAIGQPGEIYIGGAALARGYLGRPDLTADAFVPNPIDPDHSARLYRTGDIGRYRQDGAIEFLGRRDQQIKVRGMRVELAEVEAALRRLDGVTDCTLALRAHGDSDTRIVAYVETDSLLSSSAIRAQLARRLPDYMVPDLVVPLARLPRTPSGKIDTAALPEPLLNRADGPDGAPLGDLESMIAAVFSELLEVPRIGRADHFFDLGGHSLVAARAMARLRQALGLKLPLRVLFDAPTVAGLASAIQQALAAGPQRQENEREAFSPIRPIARGQSLPASFAQERLWLLDQLEPETAVYNVPIAWRLDGSLSVGALQTALDGLVDRHEPLRTTFVQTSGAVRQVVAEESRLPLQIVDLRQIEAKHRESSAIALATDEARRPFDLISGPLARATVFQLGPSDHLFLLVVHHIAADGWSVDVLLRDLGSLYAAAVEGRPASLAELPIQYADVAQWQRDSLAGAVLSAQLQYWTAQLAGVPPLLELPADRPRPVRQSTSGARVAIALPRSLVEGLRALGRHEGTTLFMTLLAGFQTLLARYTPSDGKDIVVGTPVANRSRPEVEDLVGLFTNTLPIRLDCSDRPAFRAMLQRVREAALGAFAHQDLPFEQLVEALNPPRSLSYSPLFQVMMVLEESAEEILTLPGVTSRRLALETGTAKFDITLSLQIARDGGVRGYLEYCTDLFDSSTADRMAGHLERLLEAAIAAPDVPIAELPMLSAAERGQLAAWNATAVDVPSGCIHHFIDAQAQRTPEAVAVVCNGVSLTYRDLNQRANQLAHYLRGFGVGPDVVVALRFERSLDMMIALLGILKAGGAYLPLDPKYPADRRAFVLADSGAGLLVTHGPTTPVEPGIRVVRLDVDGPAISTRSVELPDSGVTPDNLAYVIYTSGSTGRPKGVTVEHHNVANLFTGMDAVVGSAPGVWLALTSISFDISVLELFWTLSRGFTVVLPTGDRWHGDDHANGFARMIDAHQVTHFQCTPSLIQTVALQPGALDALQRLQCLFIGGEPLPPTVLELLGDAPSRRIVNMYGPTETTVWSLTADVHVNEPITIGRPIANTQVHVLDEARRLVPVGMIGELFISGAGVARGYLKRPELTSERFVPDTHSGRGAMYRTGDLVRRRADGTVEFIGRADHQVKIRGHRIELGEIETTLRDHPDVADAVVVVREDAPGDKRLVAYLVATSGAPAPRDLRTRAAGVLPDYMVPAAYVFLDQLPLTPNGKVDRRALPAPYNEPVVSVDETSTAHEEAVARIWTDVFYLGDPSRLRLDDDFFEIGGHSLAAARVIARVREVFGVNLPLRVLFEAPTVRALAAAVARCSSIAEPGGAPGFAVALHPNGSLPPFFFLNAATEGGGFYSQQLGRCLGPEQPYYSLALLGLDGSPVPETVAAIAQVYVRFMRERQPHGPYRLGGFCVSGPVVLEIARQMRALGETVALIVVVESWIQNVSRRSRVAEKIITGLGRLIRLDGRATVDLFLALGRLLGSRPPSRPDPDAPIGKRVRQHYIRVASAYVPKPSDVRLVHLRTARDPDPRWWRLSSRFSDRVIPGDHDTCVTEHVGALAMALRRCLDESRKPPASRDVTEATPTAKRRPAALGERVDA